MAQATHGSPIREFKGETKALSSTAGYVTLEPGFQEVMLYCSAAWRLHLTPRLAYVLFYSASAETYTDYSPQVRDRVASTHAPLDAMTTSDYLYVGCSDTFLGLNVDMGSNVNASTATLDVEYWNGTAWTDVSGDSDGTDDGGATLGQDGVYTWTLPTDWAKTVVNELSPFYWIRFAPSDTLSATVDVAGLDSIARDTNYGYWEAGTPYQFSLNIDKVGALQVIVASGTPTLNITWIRH